MYIAIKDFNTERKDYVKGQEVPEMDALKYAECVKNTEEKKQETKSVEILEIEDKIEKISESKEELLIETSSEVDVEIEDKNDEPKTTIVSKLFGK